MNPGSMIVLSVDLTIIDTTGEVIGPRQYLVRPSLEYFLPPWLRVSIGEISGANNASHDMHPIIIPWPACIKVGSWLYELCIFAGI
jgi:hypothetical protein